MLEIETKQNQILTEINNMLFQQAAPSEAEIELSNPMVIGKPLTSFSLIKKSKPPTSRFSAT